MSFSEPPSTDPRLAGPPAGDLDGLLRTFFQAEMPRPWPAAPVPGRPSASRNDSPKPATRDLFRPKRWSLSSSRLALAAALAGLMIGTLLLSGRFQANKAPEILPGAPALGDTKYLMKEYLSQPIEEKVGADGKPVRQENPTKYVIEFFDQLAP
jgi:hypothetical protein